jgi:hypothetical protein
MSQWYASRVASVKNKKLKIKNSDTVSVIPANAGIQNINVDPDINLE